MEMGKQFEINRRINYYNYATGCNNLSYRSSLSKISSRIFVRMEQKGGREKRKEIERERKKSGLMRGFIPWECYSRIFKFTREEIGRKPFHR